MGSQGSRPPARPRARAHLNHGGGELLGLLDLHRQQARQLVEADVVVDLHAHDAAAQQSQATERQ